MEPSLIIICSTHKKRCLKFCKSESEDSSTRFQCPECLKQISCKESLDLIDISNYVSTNQLIESMFLINEDFVKLQQFFMESFEKIEYFQTLLDSLKKAMKEVQKKFLDAQKRIFEEVFLKKWNVANEGLLSCFLDFAATNIEQSKWSSSINVSESVKTQFKGLFKESAKELKRFFRQRVVQDNENDQLKEKQQRIQQAQNELNKELSVYLNGQMKQLNPKWVEESLIEKEIGIKAKLNNNEDNNSSQSEIKQEQVKLGSLPVRGLCEIKTELICQKDQKQQTQSSENEKQSNQRGRQSNQNNDKSENDLCIQKQVVFNDEQVNHPKDQKQASLQQQQHEKSTNVYPKTREPSQGKSQSGIVVYQVNKNSNHEYEIKKIEAQPKVIQQAVESENKEKSLIGQKEQAKQVQIQQVVQKVEAKVIEDNQTDRQKDNTNLEDTHVNAVHNATEQLTTQQNDKQTPEHAQQEQNEKPNSESTQQNKKYRQQRKRHHPNEQNQRIMYEKVGETNKFLQSSQNHNYQQQNSNINNSNNNSNTKINNYNQTNSNQNNNSASKMVVNGYYINTENGSFQEMDNKNQTYHQQERNRHSNYTDTHSRSSQQYVRAPSKNNKEEIMKSKIYYQPKEDNIKTQINNEQNRNNFRNNNNGYQQEYPAHTDVRNNRGQSKNNRRQSKDNRMYNQESNQRTRLNNNQQEQQEFYVKKYQQ